MRRASNRWGLGETVRRSAMRGGLRGASWHSLTLSNCDDFKEDLVGLQVARDGSFLDGGSLALFDNDCSHCSAG